ncbi:T9SS type A sorting domain-containing protein [Epilithonimonas pallida]|uniref:Por secretion system C-terminal sorting domain-containing protein n=1 Tax=Epilithonimonas pallida TaxID=373671 RepID=A0ABY1R2P6_9FLAO|nr:T9SS type A sorting domain-containing protein [Epilithonimonas pallida]SMP92751.1 Por secretion system C-terminal sorting domain-containing protein [Epilithonimonas pallida]
MKKIFTILSIAAVSLVSAQNLIPNNGFETWTSGKPDGWFIPTAATIAQSSTAHSGSSSLSLTSPASGNSTVSPTTDTPVTAGTTYVFSGWYLDNSTTARFKYWNQFRNTADTGANNMQAADYSTDSPSWQFFTAEAQPNAGATVARPGLRVYPENNAGGGVILFDDIMFYVKGSMAVTDIKDFDKQVQFNTIVKDQITFKLPVKSTVNIYSAEGKLISSNRVENGGSVSTQSLVKGAYIVTVDNGANKISRKVIKN